MVRDPKSTVGFVVAVADVAVVVFPLSSLVVFDLQAHFQTKRPQFRLKTTQVEFNSGRANNFFLIFQSLTQIKIQCTRQFSSRQPVRARERAKHFQVALGTLPMFV